MICFLMIIPLMKNLMGRFFFCNYTRGRLYTFLVKILDFTRIDLMIFLRQVGC